MGLYSGGRIIGRIFASEIWEAYFQGGRGGGAYFWEGLLSEFYGMFSAKKEYKCDITPVKITKTKKFFFATFLQRCKIFLLTVKFCVSICQWRY